MASTLFYLLDYIHIGTQMLWYTGEKLHIPTELKRKQVCFYIEKMFITYNQYLKNIFISMELVPAEMVCPEITPVSCVAYGILVNPFGSLWKSMICYQYLR